MRTVNKPYFVCDHCSKKYFVEHACEKHEPKCVANPDNFRACTLGCVHLQSFSKTVTFETTHGDGYKEQEIKTTGFKCLKKEIELYPYKAELKDLPNKYPEDFDGLSPMPKKCSEFKKPETLDELFIMKSNMVNG